MRVALFLAAVLTAHSAAAQIDISGIWVSSQENYRPRGNAGIGDYTGLPLNDAGRLRADTWDASILSQRERQAQPHNTQYLPVPIRGADREGAGSGHQAGDCLQPVLRVRQRRSHHLARRPAAPAGLRRAHLARLFDREVGGQHADRHDDAPAHRLHRAQRRARQPEEHGDRALHPPRRPVDAGADRQRPGLPGDAADSDHGLRAEPGGRATGPRPPASRSWTRFPTSRRATSPATRWGPGTPTGRDSSDCRGRRRAAARRRSSPITCRRSGRWSRRIRRTQARQTPNRTEGRADAASRIRWCAAAVLAALAVAGAARPGADLRHQGAAGAGLRHHDGLHAGRRRRQHRRADRRRRRGDGGHRRRRRRATRCCAPSGR